MLLLACAALICGRTAFALDPSLDISQYAHTAWTVRDGFSLGNIYAITQTPDGYLWLGTELGLVRFDGIRSVLWQPPAGQHLPNRTVYRLLAARDGTLWIGTFGGFVTLSGGKLRPPPALADEFVISLFEDREGTVWVGTEANAMRALPSRVCAMRSGSAKCYGEDNAFGHNIPAFYEDSSGNLWAGAETQVWRMNPGPPTPYATIPKILSALSESDDGRLLLAKYGAGVFQLAGNKVESYPIRAAINANRLLPDHDVNSNKLLRDRDGGLWIGTVDRGLIHVHHGRTDVFAKSDGLSGDIVLALFEDREGNVWVATTGGLDRFRELPVNTISVKQGLPTDAVSSVLASNDGSIWLASPHGLTRWKQGQTTTFRKPNGLPDDTIQSLFQDDDGRIWVSTAHGLAYFRDGRFFAVAVAPDQQVHSIAGDKVGNIWFSESRTLLKLREGRLLEHIPWSELRRIESASVLASDRDNGELWFGFWNGGGVSSFKDGRLHESYSTADGLAEGPVQGLQLDQDGALWVATLSGVSRIKDGRIATLSSKNGLPCDTVLSSIRDDDGLFWLYTACGLVRITPSELNAWIVDPKHRIQTTVWDAADGVRIRSVAATAFTPRISKASDGKLWFLTGEGVQVIDPHHLAVNKIPPPVRIEQIIADHKVQWQNITGAAVTNLRLPARTHDLQIDYTALSLVAPEKAHFKYMLEGQDQDWREVVNERLAQYTNLPPRHYRFRVIASNNSGLWNEEGAALDFVIPPAWYQTNWFRALCLAVFLALLWALYQLRLRQLAGQFNMRLEERVGERTRIARDLHDTLLQSFHGVLLYFQTGINQLPEHPVEARTGEARKTLEKAMHQAEHAIVEGREAIQGLRSSVVETNDLAVAMRTLGEELAANSNSTAFQVHVEGTPRDLHPILRDEVYRITGEGIRNAFHHADAKQIEVEIRYDDRRLRVRVRDDGKGIDPKLLSGDAPQGHFGLRGMRERAKLIGGKLTVWSELDAGTEVELSIPAARAYTTATDGQKMSLTEKPLAKLSGRGTAKKP